MCQCGCGETTAERAFQLPGGAVIAVHIYRGCRDCFSGPSVDLHIYPNRKSEWLEGVKIEKFKPDQYGGNHGRGIQVPLFEVRDLKAEIGAKPDLYGNPEDFGGVDEWLDEIGLQMVQGAIRRYDKRAGDVK